MTNSIFVACFAASIFVAVGCDRPSVTTHEPPDDRYLSDPNSIGFDIKPVQDQGFTHRWLATYTSQGKTARFRIELSESKPLDDKEPQDFDIESGTGRLVAEPGSDASVLLADLKKALEAKKLPAKVKSVSNLPFQFVTFGKHNSQSPRGGFSTKPPGNWTPMKIFIGEGEQEGQVFLNLNPVLKKGQFSMKDQEYGDIVLAQLAQVL